MAATSQVFPLTLDNSSPPGPRLVTKPEPRYCGVVASLTKEGFENLLGLGISPRAKTLNKRGEGKRAAAKSSNDKTTGKAPSVREPIQHGLHIRGGSAQISPKSNFHLKRRGVGTTIAQSANHIASIEKGQGLNRDTKPSNTKPQAKHNRPSSHGLPNPHPHRPGTKQSCRDATTGDHDGHRPGGGVKRPVGGTGGDHAALSRQLAGDGAPAVGGAEADVGRKGRNQHGPPVAISGEMASSNANASESID